MTETKKFVVTDGPINHDHELYQNGDEIELPKKAADRLTRERKVAPFKEAKPPANDKDDSAKAGDKSDSAAAGKDTAPKGDSEKDNLKNKVSTKPGGKK